MRMIRPSAAIALMLAVSPAPLVAEEQVYRTVDEQGRVIFSDQPSAGAEPVQVGPANTMSQPARTAPAQGPATSSPAVASAYTLVAITEPADGATVIDQLGAFTVQFRTEPRLQPGHPVRLLLDDEPIGTPVADGIRVTGSSRGDHILKLQILDGDGRLLGQSGSVRVLVVRPGPNGKKRPG